MVDNIHTFENFLTAEECDYILTKYKNELELSPAQTTNGYTHSYSKGRKSSIGWINEINNINERLTNLLKITYDIYGIEVTKLGPFQFTEYKVGEYFNWHFDRDSELYIDRFVSTVILLNDNYNGGVLEMQDMNGETLSTNKKMGNLYIFDSGLMHRVTPVEDGIRYSLVNWVSVVKTNKNKKSII